ncbi:MAG: hypothetical protein AAF206_02660 [Bacteroidota bacterium]
MISIGNLKKTYHFNLPKDVFIRHLSEGITRSPQIEGNVKWGKTLEILSVEKILASFFHKEHAFWARGQLKEVDNGTQLSLKIGTYWVWELVVVFGILFLILMTGMVIYDSFSPIFTRRGAQIEISLLIAWSAFLFQLWRNSRYKRSGERIIDQMIQSIRQNIHSEP